MRYLLLSTESGVAFAILVSLTPLGAEPGGVFCAVHLQLSKLYASIYGNASTILDEKEYGCMTTV